MPNGQLQHYLPRFLLRRFSTGKKEHIHVFDKQTSKRFACSARKIAAEKNLYDFTFKDVALTLESGLAKLEARAAQHISHIIREARLDVINPAQRADLAQFIAVQMVRTPAFWETSRDMFDRMEAWLRKEGVQDSWFDPPKELGTRENASRAVFAQTISSATSDLGPELISKDWLLLQTDHKHPYIIGDNPVAMHNTIDHSPRGNIGIGVKGIQIYFPLTPRLSLSLICPSHREFLVEKASRLVAKFANQPSMHEHISNALGGTFRILDAITKGIPLPSNPENTLFHNSLQVLNAERFVFSTNGDFSLVEDMIRENSDLRHGRRLVESTGKF